MEGVLSLTPQQTPLPPWRAVFQPLAYASASAVGRAGAALVQHYDNWDSVILLPSPETWMPASG